MASARVKQAEIQWTSGYAELKCPGCGRTRLVSERNARRNPQSCNLCRSKPSRKPPDDTDRRFWLKLFSDREILEIAFAVFEEEGDAETVLTWRQELLPKSVEKELMRRAREVNDSLSPNGEGQLRQQVRSTASA